MSKKKNKNIFEFENKLNHILVEYNKIKKIKYGLHRF